MINFFVVHTTVGLKMGLWMAQAFLSQEWYSKIKYIERIHELCNTLPPLNLPVEVHTYEFNIY